MEKEAPVHISNVMVICPSCSKPTRIASKQLKEGKRTRICAKCEAEVGKK